MPTTLPHANDSVPPTVAQLAAVSTIARSQRQRAAQLLREHGSDTLSAFKLRQDLQQRFHAHGRAVVAQRAVSGVLLLAGDPVCAPADLPMALNAARLEARSRGLALGAVGASQACRDAACELGLRSLYLGDEALLPTGVMNLSGNAHRSLRKAVNRVARGGYTAELLRCGDLDERMLGQLTDVSDAWLDGTAERGFSMTHDRIDDELLPDALVIVARDESGRVRGFLHFVPVFGRPVVSLAFMRRERDTPNGLIDFLVVRAAELLAAEGIGEFSLNFAAFGRWLRDPAGPGERALARVLRGCDRWFQIERLYRYNAKFSPRWAPRYLLYESYLGLPRTAVAALRAEGQMPSLPFSRLARTGGA